MNKKINLDQGTDLPEKFILTDEFKKLYDKIENTSSNLFITGKAGCGKSTLLEYFRQNTNKNYAIVAPTGLTAIKARGMTIHSFFKLPPRFIQKQDVKMMKDPAVLKKLDILLIDECSMMRADILDGIDESLRKNRGSKKVFGGVQIILFGDLLQLAPVVSSTEEASVKEVYADGSYFFNANVFNKAEFQTNELTKIFRQSDEEFINLLNKFRIAKIDEKDLSLINERFQGEDFELPEGIIMLATRNDKVDSINNSKLNEIDSRLFEYEAEIKGTFKESEHPAPKTLKLKVGAQVMLTKNDTNSEPRKWVNGTLATVDELGSNFIKVKIKDKILTVGKNRWEKYDYKIDGGSITHKVVATFLQYPLKLAWASTIHKCQGQTFDKVAIDFDRGSFAHGQTYVALSRARTIEGIYLMREITFKDLIFDNKVFSFLGNELEKKYMDEIDNKKTTKKVAASKKIEEVTSDTATEEWSKEDDKKLIMLYKKNVPEHALANIFKKRRTEVRTRILKILK
jgi:hypothetical protein